MRPTQDYTLAGVITHAVDRRLANVHTCIPAKVTRYDETLQQVDAQPLVKAVYRNEQGEQLVESLPLVVNVPVMFPGAGKYRITFPVEVDTTVLLLFTEASLDKWLAQGGEVDPLDGRRFHLSDGIALLGLHDFAHALASAPLDRMTIGDDTGLQIHIDGSKVKLGSNVTAELEPVALGLAVETALTSIRTFINTHTHSGVTTGAGASGPPAAPLAALPDVKSTSVDVKK